MIDPAGAVVAGWVPGRERFERGDTILIGITSGFFAFFSDFEPGYR
jgi:hypothetical protein